MVKGTKKYLGQENKWLWYHYQQVQDDTVHTEFKQYDKWGVLVAVSSSVIPPKKDRPKHPSEVDIK